MKTAFVILSYRNTVDTVECIDSILHINTPREQYGIILVDNSEDDQKCLSDILARVDVDFAIATENNGYSHGNNIGIQHAITQGYDYICVINNDTIVDPNFLNELLSVVTRKTSVALVAPVIYTYKDKKIWSSGGVYNRKRCNYLMTREKVSDVKPCEFLNGCCILFHRTLINDIGYMDEDYFMYSEDADWCYKIAQKGFNNFVVPSSQIIHKVSLSSGVNSPFQVYYLYKNRFLFIQKNMTGYHKLYGYVVNYGQAIIRMVQYAVKSRKCAKALWYAIVDARKIKGRGRY